MSGSHASVHGTSSSRSGIHIISWNVAGWIKTLQYIEKVCLHLTDSACRLSISLVAVEFRCLENSRIHF